MKNNSSIVIGNQKVSYSSPTYFVADIAANWDGSLERAKDLIHLCAEAGADAAKFQNFQAATIVSDYSFKNIKGGKQLSHQSKWKKSVFDVYKDASLPPEWTADLKETCDKVGIGYMTTPYDLTQLTDLSKYVCAWKLGSGDLTWHQIIELLAKDGKPFMIASGASDMSEVRMAIKLAQKFNDKIILMQCNTNYTASLENFKHIHLNVLKTYAKEYPNLILGLSDHTPGHSTVLGAVALGARVIEKHFTDDNDREGPDHKFSMTPNTWREMVDRTRELESALGMDEKRVAENERESIVVQRRSIHARRALQKGYILSENDMVMLRPCPQDSFPPYKVGELIGKVLQRDVPEGDCIYSKDVV